MISQTGQDLLLGGVQIMPSKLLAKLASHLPDGVTQLSLAVGKPRLFPHDLAPLSIEMKERIDPLDPFLRLLV
jgi:hypothetical protein